MNETESESNSQGFLNSSDSEQVGVDDRRRVLADCPETSAALKASNGQWSYVLRNTAMRLELERNVLARRLNHLIRNAYTQQGTDGVLYWCCELFPVGEHETFNAALDADISSENDKLISC